MRGQCRTEGPCPRSECNCGFYDTAVDGLASDQHTVGSDPEREARIAASKASGRKPYCIWDAENADTWHSSSREVQDAWDAYVQREVDIWNNREGTYDRGAHLYHQWTPPLRFSQWFAQSYPAPQSREACSS